jgi:hypothetical protein
VSTVSLHITYCKPLISPSKHGALGVETKGGSVNACLVIWAVRDPNSHHNDRASIMGSPCWGLRGCQDKSHPPKPELRLQQVTQVLRSISKLIQRLPAMSFDFVILVMTLFVLRKRFRHEDLSGLLCRDGLIYFLITSTCNTVPAVGPLLRHAPTQADITQVLAALNLNSEPVMLQCFYIQT